jgi:hypothetical protein
VAADAAACTAALEAHRNATVVGLATVWKQAQDQLAAVQQQLIKAATAQHTATAFQGHTGDAPASAPSAAPHRDLDTTDMTTDPAADTGTATEPAAGKATQGPTAAAAAAPQDQLAAAGPSAPTAPASTQQQQQQLGTSSTQAGMKRARTTPPPAAAAGTVAAPFSPAVSAGVAQGPLREPRRPAGEAVTAAAVADTEEPAAVRRCLGPAAAVMDAPAPTHHPQQVQNSNQQRPWQQQHHHQGPGRHQGGALNDSALCDPSLCVDSH